MKPKLKIIVAMMLLALCLSTSAKSIITEIKGIDKKNPAYSNVKNAITQITDSIEKKTGMGYLMRVLKNY